MLLSTKLLAAALLLATLAGAFLLYGRSERSAGRLEERTAQLEAHAEWRKQFDKDRAAGALRVAKAEANLREARKQTDAKIAELQARDESIRAWMATRFPVALADIVWMSDAGPVSSVPGGPVTDSGIDLTAASYRISHKR